MVKKTFTTEPHRLYPLNPYKSSVLIERRKQTVQAQIRCCRMRRLIRVSLLAYRMLHKNIWKKYENYHSRTLKGNRLVQLIKVGKIHFVLNLLFSRKSSITAILINCNGVSPITETTHVRYQNSNILGRSP